MESKHTARFILIALVLALASVWSAASAYQGRLAAYPGDFMVTGEWLKSHLADPGLLVVDVRQDKYQDGRVIPGSVRLPYDLFQEDDPARGVAAVFAGTAAAQRILGDHGVGREATVVLYDSVKRDGGATSSYVFWVLDLLGHEKVKVLERGIDGWADAGGELADAHAEAEAVLYQASADEIDLRKFTGADFVNSRLGDPHYTILDVRSPEEYLGQAPNKALNGGPLKLGHIPTAVNVEYKMNWADAESKALKEYGQLLELYRGLDPSTTVVVYCHSGRRASFTYWVLRQMGFQNVMLLEGSWNEWGDTNAFYPVETQERKLTGSGLPTGMKKADASTAKTGAKGGGREPAKSGYVSCGG